MKLWTHKSSLAHPAVNLPLSSQFGGCSRRRIQKLFQHYSIRSGRVFSLLIRRVGVSAGGRRSRIEMFAPLFLLSRAATSFFRREKHRFWTSAAKNSSLLPFHYRILCSSRKFRSSFIMEITFRINQARIQHKSNGACFSKRRKGGEMPPFAGSRKPCPHSAKTDRAISNTAIDWFDTHCKSQKPLCL